MKSNVKKFASVLLAAVVLFSMCALFSVSAAGPSLTVQATSNFFAAKTETIQDINSCKDANGDVFITVEYKVLAAGQYIINVDVDELTYDPAVLEWKEEYNTYGARTVDFFPFAAETGLGSGMVNKTADGRLVGNFSSIDPAAWGYNEDNTPVTVVKATFKLLNPNAGTVTVNCSVDTLTYCDVSETKPYLKSIAIDKKVVDETNKAKATYSTFVTTGTPEVLIGDVDRNGKVDINDATCLQSYLAEFIGAGALNLNAADVNGDNKIDVRDVTAIQRMLLV